MQGEWMASPSQRAAGRSAGRGGVPGLAPLLKSAPTRLGAVGELRIGRAACLEYTCISTGIHKVYVHMWRDVSHYISLRPR